MTTNQTASTHTHERVIRVFISSTFRDMHAERDHLVKVVFSKLRQWCEERRLRLVDIDLRWGVTKEEADNGKAIEICLQEIDGSRPFFVCLLGERYGWVPTPDNLPEEEMYRFRGLQQAAHLSITHLEILHATQQPIQRKDRKRHELCQHSYFYFRKSDCVPRPESLTHLSQQQRAEFAAAFFEPSPQPGQLDRRTMLAGLKDQIRQQFQEKTSVWEYSGTWQPRGQNPEDDKLIGRLTGLDTFGERVEADLKRSIARQFAEHIAALGNKLDPLDEERVYHEAFLENRTQVHVPRVDVERRLSEYIASDERRPFVLSGPPGTGKSVILAHWLVEHVDLDTWTLKRDPAVLVVGRFIGASPASTNLARLLAGVCGEFARRFGLTEEVQEPGPDQPETVKTQPMAVPADPNEALRKWPKFLEAAAAQGLVVVVLDAVNQLDSSTDATRSFWIPSQLPVGVRLIVSVLDHGAPSRVDHRSADDEPADWLNVLRRRELPVHPVPQLDDATCREMIRQLPNVFCKTLDSKQIDALLKNEATRNPLFLTVALEELRVFGSFEKLPQRIADLPQLASAAAILGGDLRDPHSPVRARIDRTTLPDIDAALDAMFGQVLDRIDAEAARRGAPGLVPTLFRLLASAKEGLSELEMSQLLSLRLPDLPSATRDGELQVILRQIRSYLMRKTHPQGALVDFYHRSFWKAVRAKPAYLTTAAELYSSHRDLAAYFDAQEYFLEPIEKQRERMQPPYSSRPVNLRKVNELPWHFLRCAEEARSGEPVDELQQSLGDIYRLFTTLDFLEAKNEAGLVFDLPADFTVATRVFSEKDDGFRILKLLDEAVRRDIHFIARFPEDYPQGLFQCLWNSCWWYDCPEAANHYEEPQVDGEMPAPWKMAGPKLHRVLNRWRNEKEGATPGFLWIRSLRPPPNQLAGTLRAVLPHSGKVSGVAFSPDNKLIASASDDKVYFWETTSSRLTHYFTVDSGCVHSVAFSPNAERLVTASEDGTVCIWNVSSGQQDFRMLGQTVSRALRASFSSDGSRILGCLLGSIHVWDARTGRQLLELSCRQGGFGTLKSASFSPDGTRVVIAAEDAAPGLYVMDAQSGHNLLRLYGHEDKVYDAAFSPDGSRIVSSSRDWSVRLWDAESGNQIRCLGKHGNRVYSVAFGPDGQHVVSASWDNTACVFDAEKGEPLVLLSGHTNRVNRAVFNANGSLVASASDDGTVRIWNVSSTTAERPLRGQHRRAIRRVLFSRDEARLFSISSKLNWTGDKATDVCVISWDPEHGTPILLADESPVIRAALDGCVDVTKEWHRDQQESSRNLLDTEQEHIERLQRPAERSWTTVCGQHDTAFVNTKTGSVAYMFPERIDKVSCGQPGGCLWSGAVSVENRDSYREYDEARARYLYILRREGQISDVTERLPSHRVEPQLDAHLWRKMEEAVRRIVALVHEFPFEKACEAVSGIPDEVTEFSEIKRILPAIIGREEAIEQSKKLVDAGKFNEARDIIHRLPDVPNELGEQKSYLTTYLLVQIDEAEKQGRRNKQVEEAIEQSKKLVGAGEFSEARETIHRLPDDPNELKELKTNLLGQIDEAEKQGRRNKQVEEAIEQSKKLVGAGELEKAKSRISHLPNEPADMLDLKNNVLKQITEVEHLSISARSKNLRILSNLARVGITQSMIAQVARDNNVDVNNVLQFNALLEAVVTQVPGLARAATERADGGRGGPTATGDPSKSSAKKWWRFWQWWQ